MKDEVTGNTLLECPIGFYDVETESFLVVEQIHDVSSINEDWHCVVLNYEDDIRDKEIYRILYEFTPLDLEKSMWIFINNIYENKRNNNKSKDTGSSV